MKLADRLAQCRAPLIVKDTSSGILSHLNGAAEFANRVAQCPIRYVLSDDLTRLCTALAYSKGSRTFSCADLLVRTFWSDKEAATDVLASSMEAYFDFDTPAGEEPQPTDDEYRSTVTVSDAESGNLLRKCVRFRYEHSWDRYYQRARCSIAAKQAIARHALSTIAVDIPVLLAFLLLLGMRSGVSHRAQSFERLNRSRARVGKMPLLDHVEVHSPILPPYRSVTAGAGCGGMGRHTRRLHHVRGHLVRRGSKIFWRIPHLRGNLRAGSIRTRTVTWTVNESSSCNAQAADIHAH